jgi:UDP-N-acetylmuramate--alanine ligase
MREFAEVLSAVDNLLIYKTYPAREMYDEEGSAERLAQVVGNCLYVENVFTLKTWIRQTIKEGDILLFLGAGDIYYVAEYVLSKLN